MNLSTDEMINVARVFQESYKHVIGNMSLQLEDEIHIFTQAVILSEKPYMLVTPDGLTHAREMVFAYDIRRDFLFTLSFTFVSRLGMGSEYYQGMVKNLTDGIGVTSAGAELDAMPTEISERLTPAKEIGEVLMANRWLVMLLLIQLFITLPPEHLRAGPAER